MRIRSAPPRLAPLAGLLLAATVASAEDARIVNGVNTHDWEATGALLYSGGAVINDNNQGSWCSGTLIGCSTFLTAAHCVEDDLDASSYRVLFQHAGVFDVASITMHPSYTSGGWPAFDIAVVHLATPVTSVDPYPINDTDNPANLGFGLTGDIVGFGRTGGLSSDYGIKRAGQVVTADCATSGQGDNDDLVCWQFQNPQGNPGEDSNTCNGDSGGPLFLDVGAGSQVAGVTSGGTAFNCLPQDNSYDANVFTYRAYVLAELGVDPTSACGNLPPIGDPDVAYEGFDGSLAAGNTTADLLLTVPAGTNELRVVLNGEDNGSFDVDLYLKEGTGASPSNHDCELDGNSNFGDCVVPGPASGTWSVHLRRRSGAGEYQVTSSTFGGPPPPCTDVDGDGYGAFGSLSCTESGVDCDDGDPDVNPGMTEINGNGIDDDCDGSTPACGPQAVAYDANGRIAGVELGVLLIPVALTVVGLRRRRR